MLTVGTLSTCLDKSRHDLGDDMNSATHQQEPWDLVVVGAGIAGLNALHAATEYLPEDARVLLIDKRERIGGMWNTTYDHVRLHQPYQFFTVGDIKWQLGKEPSHLASRFEVLEHFRHCLDIIAQRCNLHVMFGTSYERHEEAVDKDGTAMARVQVTDESGRRVKISSKRFVKALGFNAWFHEPLEVSSKQVHSVTPESWDFMGEKMSKDAQSIYIIGGGKTGADAAYQAAKRYPGRDIHMIAGGGTSFFNRDKAFPTGTQRYTGGTPIFSVMTDLALRYGGENEQEVYDYFTEQYGLTFEGIETNGCLFGILSPEEKRVIDEHVHVRNGYFEDVIETKDGALAITFRCGERQVIEPGSWIVNCTGAVFQSEPEQEQCLSNNGAILSVTLSAAFTFLPSISSYLLTHLWMRGELADAPLWLMNHLMLSQTSRKNAIVSVSTQTVYNLLIATDKLGAKRWLQGGLNFDNWYPTYRVLWMFGKLKGRRNVLSQLRTALERFETRHPLRRPVVGELSMPSTNMPSTNTPGTNTPDRQQVDNVIGVTSAG